jgi:hypothetical protein
MQTGDHVPARQKISAQFRDGTVIEALREALRVS